MACLGGENEQSTTTTPHSHLVRPEKKKQLKLKLKPSSADVYLPTYLTVKPGKQTECLVSSSKLTDKHSPPPTLNYSRNTLLPTHYIHKPSQWQELPKTSRLCSSMRGKNPRSFPLLHFPPRSIASSASHWLTKMQCQSRTRPSNQWSVCSLLPAFHTSWTPWNSVLSFGTDFNWQLVRSLSMLRR
jgi:hypothetical protein